MKNPRKVGNTYHAAKATWGVVVVSVKMSQEIYDEIKEIVASSVRTMKNPLTMNGWINRAIRRDLEHRARSKKKKKNLLTQENGTVN